MHLNPITYEEFVFYGDYLYELSKKMLQEKVLIFLYIYFKNNYIYLKVIF